MDCNPPGSSVHGILQARVLEWIAISSSNNKLGWSANSCLQMGPCTCMVVPSWLWLDPSTPLKVLAQEGCKWPVLLTILWCLVHDQHPLWQFLTEGGRKGGETRSLHLAATRGAALTTWRFRSWQEMVLWRRDRETGQAEACYGAGEFVRVAIRTASCLSRATSSLPNELPSCSKRQWTWPEWRIADKSIPYFPRLPWS